MSTPAHAQGAVDLHLHSSASDGSLAPEDLVAYAAARGVRVLALTDHDTVDGLPAATAAAALHGVRLVAGIEVSAAWRGRTVHVVGLGIDPAARVLASMLAAQRELREQRASDIAARLDRARAPGAAALELARASGVAPTRTHFARALVELGVAKDLDTAFDRWLGDGKPAHVPPEWPALDAVLAALVDAKGIPVLAHPLRYRCSAGQRRELAREFRDAGGIGIEIACGGGGPQQVEEATALALRAGLEGSAGSDFHDPGMAWNPPGRLAKLPASVVPVWRRLDVAGDVGIA